MLDDLALFISVVEAGSFSQAAFNLEISQATITRRIQSLEDSLGFPVIKRNTRGISVTEQGENLYTKIKPSYTNITNNIELLKARTQKYSGKLKVSLVPGISRYLITAKIPGFLIEHPEIQLELTFQTREVDLVSQQYDLALVAYRPSQANIKLKQIYSEPVHLYCTTEYAKNYGLPKSLDDVVNHRVCGAVLNSNDTNVLIAHQTGGIVNSPLGQRSLPVITNTLDQAKIMVLSHQIIAGGAEIFYREELKTKQVILVLPEYSFGKLELYLIRRNETHNAISDLFMRFIEGCLKEGEANND